MIRRRARSARIPWGVALLVGFFVSSAISVWRPAYGPGLGFGDHYTHMNAARLFPRVGTALWRTPVDRLLPPATDAEAALAPELASAGSVRSIDAVPGWPPQKPYAGVWTSVPRPYPPGVLVLVAPIAALYHFTSLSFSWAAHLLIVVFLGFVALAFHRIALDAPESDTNGTRDRALYGAAGVVAYAYVTFWTLRGFYDAAALVPIVVCGQSLRRGHPLRAGVAFAVALFVQFRALFYVPWALLAAWRGIEARAWRSWSLRDWAGAVAGALLGGAALYTFALVAPSLHDLPLANPVHQGDVRVSSLAAFAVAVGVAAWLFGREGACLDMAMLVWLSVMLVAIRQLQAWHAFIFVPWVFAAAPSAAVRFGRLQWAVVVTLAVIL